MLSISTTTKSIITGNSDLQNDFRGIDLCQVVLYLCSAKHVPQQI